MAGRSYEIHHINGDKTDNRPENLAALTIQEHYNIHYAQSDWMACYRIAQRMEKSPQELSELASIAARERVAKGTHHLLGGKIQRRQVANGTHLFVRDNPSPKCVVAGTHNFLGGVHQHILLANGQHNTQEKHICPNCQKEGYGPVMFRYHFDNCKINRLGKTG